MAALALLVLALSPAFGRAGGGESYPSSSAQSEPRTGSQASSYSPNSGPDSYELGRRRRNRRYRDRSMVENLMGTLAALATLLLGGKRGVRRYQEREIARSFRDRSASEAWSGFERLRHRDPSLELGAFLRFARESFGSVQRAWRGGDPGQAGALLCAALRESLAASLRLSPPDSAAPEAHLEDASITQVEEGHCDLIHVRMNGKEGALAFSEIWTFRRSEGSWRLSEITQAAEWSPRGFGEAPEGLCAQELEESAAAGFWAWLPASGLAFDRPAVGGARLIAGDIDRAHVEIKWSSVLPEGHALRRHVVTLGLHAGRWQLESVLSKTDWEKRLESPPPAPDWSKPLSTVDALSLMAVAVFTDRKAGDAELRYFRDYARQAGVEAEKAERLLEAARLNRLEIPRPSSGAEAEHMLKGLIHSSLADGTICSAELGLLRAYSARLGLPPKQLDAMVDEERRALYAAIRI